MAEYQDYDSDSSDYFIALNEIEEEDGSFMLGEDEEGSQDHAEGDNLAIFGPYMFEPVRKVESPMSQESRVHPAAANAEWRKDPARLDEWCKCKNCQSMPTSDECNCCTESLPVQNKMDEEELDVRPVCITEHPGFEPVCLNKWTLQTAWLFYKQQYGGKAVEGPPQKKLRHVAYRQLIRWCWGYAGKHNRIVLPACAVSCIRAHYPPPGDENIHEFTGFKPAKLPHLM